MINNYISYRTSNVKTKIITTAVLSALYSAGTLNAAVPDFNALDNKHHRLQKTTFDPEQIIEQSLGNNRDGYSVLKDNGLNVLINSTKNKFVKEENLTGEHVYIIRLRAPALSERTFSQTTRMRGAGSQKLFSAGEPVNNEVSLAKSAILHKQSEVLNELAVHTGGAKIRQQFTTALNGFTLKLTQEQAERVATNPQVLSVQRSKTYQMHSDVGPQLIQADRVWSGEASQGIQYKGEGLIIGVVDSGINSDHESFKEISADGYKHINPFGEGVFVGDCEIKEFADRCNDKLIGIRSYSVITDAFTTGELGGVAPAIGEDYHGHGSHVAATVAGNIQYNAPLSTPDVSNASDGSILKENFFEQISGVAPRANIISYQVCQPLSSAVGGCPGEALIAGIEDAITDGVDVINFSIGGQDSHPWSDAIEMAFLGARKAGISVAAAAGNSGRSGQYEEMFGAIDHASPWLLNVAATTHGREVIVETTATTPSFIDETQSGTLPGWTELKGGAINTESVTGVVLQAKDYPDVNGEYSAYCANEFAENTFDFYPDGSPILDTQGQTANTIVVCARDSLSNANGVARALKASNVEAGGADGFILYNYGWDDPISYTSKYSIPSVHISYGSWHGDYTNGYSALKQWLTNNGKGHTLTITPTLIESEIVAENVDKLADFSSRGPSPSTPEALIPAVAAPGVNVYAAWADEHPFAEISQSGDYNFLSGTSMASPHAAGALALIKQAHPDWSPSEIQSALVSTADETVKYNYFNRPGGELIDVSTYRAGTGRINVANAVEAGLVLDETAENFAAADPNNGGAVHRLNLPQLVNFNCQPTCSWLRTVKATKDGTWKVQSDDVKNWAFDAKKQYQQNGITITTQPSEFSLKAGETQTIIVSASVMDTQDLFSNSEVELHSALRLSEVNNVSPDMHWPMVFKYDANDMPSKLDVVAHRNDDKHEFHGIKLPEGDNVGRVYQPVKAQQYTLSLPKDKDSYRPWSTNDDKGTFEQRVDESTHLEWVNVPAGSKRLVAEVTGLVESELKGHQDLGNLAVFIGKDYNGDSIVDLDDEILCVSSHTLYDNFCNINNPEEGKYWIIFHNAKRGFDDVNYDDIIETSKVAIAVVADTPADNMSLDVPYSDGKQGTSVVLNWSDSQMQEGDIYYSLIDFGTSQVNAGNIGKTALKIVRGKDDVSLAATQTAAKKGDIIKYTFDILANQSGQEREYEIAATLPEGLKVVNIASNREKYTSEISQDGQNVVIKGIQSDSSTIEPNYVITTNVTDQSCLTPDFGGENSGGYVDLAEFGILPVLSGFAPIEEGEDGYVLPYKDGTIYHQEGIILPVSTLFQGQYDNVHLYNNAEYLNVGKKNAIEIRSTGMIAFMAGAPIFGPFHYPMPNNGLPYEQIAPLWRAMDFSTEYMMSVPLYQSPFDPEGISIATTASGWGIIEFDNARSYSFAGMQQNGAYSWEEQDDRFDFELLFNVNTLHGDGDYELIMAYDNIDFGSQNGRGSIGLQGYRGPSHTYGPIEGFLGEQFAYDELDKVLSDGLVVCYDYEGPESSAFKISLWAEVEASGVGKDLTLSAISKVNGITDIELTHTLSSPSNIVVGEIDAKSIDENTSLNNLVIYYSDEENSINQITVTGENITAEVNGHESGALATITPNQDFYGETEVTVTVSDVENPSDSNSISFMLTVVSDGVEPPTGGNVEPPVENSNNSSSGSLGGLIVMLTGLLWFRRRMR